MWFNEEDLFEDDYDIPDEDDEYAGLSDEDVFESDDPLSADFALGDAEEILSDEFEVAPVLSVDRKCHADAASNYMLEIVHPEGGESVTVVVIEAENGWAYEAAIWTGSGYDTLITDLDSLATDIEELWSQPLS